MRLGLSALMGLLCASTGIAHATGPSAICSNGAVTKDGRTYQLTELLDSAHACAVSCPDQTEIPALCQNVIDLVLPGGKNEGSQDLIPIPHRGAWGLGYPLSRTTSENTRGAFDAAVANQWHYIEVDVALTGADSANTNDVFVGHYFDMVAVGGRPGSTPKDYPPFAFPNFHMRFRDQTQNSSEDSKVMLISELLEWAKANQVVILIDPKVLKAVAQPNEYEKIIALTLIKARLIGALPNVVIKTTDNYDDAISKMAPLISQSDYDANYKGKFLWNPISEVFAGKRSKDEVLDFIDSWLIHAGGGRQIATVEVGLFTPTDWSTNSFERSGTTYRNVIDYLYRNFWGTPKRTGIWHIDPMTPRGTFGLQYSAQMIGNTSDDQRGNIPMFMNYDGILSTAVTTNRPDVWDSILTN